jgi:GTP-binding protein
MPVEIIKATYLGSYNDLKKLPEHVHREIAFAGRSNVGKSSLLNFLLGRKNLARVSKIPGKTQSLNFYDIEIRDSRIHNLMMVDCPGYGYAKRSDRLREDWKNLLAEYFRSRKQLWVVIALVDASIAPQKSDLEFLNSMGAEGIPVAIAFTKSDKLSKNRIAANIRIFEEQLSRFWSELPPRFITSSQKLTGREAMLKFLTD